MSNYPSISVIIPVFNAEHYIEACLQGLISQDYPGTIECLLVDDCGNDASMEKARIFVSDYHGTIAFRFLRHESNKGAAAARNTGIRNAKGDYLFFLDSDDILADDALRSITSPVLSSHYDIVIGRYQEIGMMGRMSPSLSNGTVLKGDEILHHTLHLNVPVSVCNKLIKTSLITNNKLFFYEGIIFEDDLWSFELAVVADSLFVLDKITYFYVVREGSVMTSTLLNKQIASLKTIIREMYQYVVNHNLKMDARCHHRIEQYRLNLFRKLTNDWSLFKQTYVDLRITTHKKWYDCFLMDGWLINKQIRDFHLALPASIGAAYLYAWLAIEAFVKR